MMQQLHALEREKTKNGEWMEDAAVEVNKETRWYQTKVPFAWIHVCLQNGIRHRGVHQTNPDESSLYIDETESVEEVSLSIMGEDEKENVKTDDVEFSSEIGILLSCIGSVVGSGNIWRYPRICAQNSYSEGSLAFIIVWIISLFIWSIPVIIVEYAVGRFTRCGPLVGFRKFLGPKLVFIGGWVCMTTFMISAYYSVVVGWCLYYVYYMCAIAELPSNEVESLEIFRHFTEDTYYPVLTHSIAIIFVGGCLFGGLKWIERVNTVLVTLLLIIVLITFSWALSLQYSEIGIKFLFTPNWESLANPKVWTDAFTQNAFDTGAGMGLFCAYSAYFRRNNGAVKYGVALPLFNNLVSLICGISVFGTVFASLVGNRPTLSTTNIQQIMQDSGPGSTGLTFTWIPVLYASMGTAGRVLCGLFFICLSFAGLTTMISTLQLTTLTLKNCKVNHYVASAGAIILTFLVGLPSAINIIVLTNQDFVWGFALLISGLMFSLLVIIYGAERFRKYCVNGFAVSDWYLPSIWTFFIAFVVPIEGFIFIIWWALGFLVNNPEWNSLSPTSFMVTIIEWICLLSLILLFNLVVVKCNLNIFQLSSTGGFDPYKLYEIPEWEEAAVYELEFISVSENSDPEVILHKI